MPGERRKAKRLQSSDIFTSGNAPAPHAAPATTASSMATWKAVKQQPFDIKAIEWPALPVRCASRAAKGSGAAPDPVAKNRPVKLETDYLSALSANGKYIYLVFDTNVYLDYHLQLHHILKGRRAGRRPVLVTPFTVVQELERLKRTKRKLAGAITAALKFINTGLQSRHVPIIGQHPRDMNIGLMPIGSADDAILNCALQVKSRADSVKVPTVLVSNDYNLRTKAGMAQLKSCSLTQLMDCKQF